MQNWKIERAPYQCEMFKKCKKLCRDESHKEIVRKFHQVTIIMKDFYVWRLWKYFFNIHHACLEGLLTNLLYNLLYKIIHRWRNTPKISHLEIIWGRPPPCTPPSPGYGPGMCDSSWLLTAYCRWNDTKCIVSLANVSVKLLMFTYFFPNN